LLDFQRFSIQMKLQSAMEYLMTYGWAILIITLITGILLTLGIFRQGSFGPRAIAGSCYVSRPNGPGSTQFITLKGICGGELPQYVAQLNGQNSYVNSGNGASLNPSNAITVSAWVKLGISGAFQGIVARDNGVWIETSYSVVFGNDNKLDLRVSSTGGWTSYALNDVISTNTFASTGDWYHVVATYNYLTAGTSVGSVYVNGVLEKTNTGLTGPLFTNARNVRVGSYGLAYYLNGKMANVQIYNASLSASQVQAIYKGGLGGVPLVLQNLAGWWPLNGDPNDYSGNGNDGVAYSIVYQKV
jgi:hypothetical protein